MKTKGHNSKKSPQKGSAGGTELRDSFFYCGAEGAMRTGSQDPGEWWPKVIFGLILAITYTSQLKVIQGTLELL